MDVGSSKGHFFFLKVHVLYVFFKTPFSPWVLIPRTGWDQHSTPVPGSHGLACSRHTADAAFIRNYVAGSAPESAPGQGLLAPRPHGSISPGHQPVPAPPSPPVGPAALTVASMFLGEQVAGQRRSIGQALEGRVQEAGVAEVVKPRSHAVNPLPLQRQPLRGEEHLLRGGDTITTALVRVLAACEKETGRKAGLQSAPGGS